MQKLILGDNQFFGVNHMSEERARAQAIRFQETSAIIDALDGALEERVSTFMCTTHDRVAEICEHFRSYPERYEAFDFYPCMPYAHKYANAVTEDGVIGALRRFTPPGGMLAAAFQGGLSVVRRDLEGIIPILIDVEMKMFSGLRTPMVFLQNVVVDLLVGLGYTDALRIFADHVRSRHRAEAGFITMNLPMTLRALERAGVENPIVCANINKIGFRMSGGHSAYQEVLETHRFRAIAMSVFASGAIPAEEALHWVCSQPNIEAIVFGASSRAHIRQTRELVSGYAGITERAS